MKLLDTYLRKNNMNMNQFHIITGIPETTVRNLNKKPLNKWTMEQIDAVAKTVRKSRKLVLAELEQVHMSEENSRLLGKFNLENRRYIGSKSKLLKWIKELIEEHTTGDSFFDVFAGTGVVSKELLHNYNVFILNDFLYSNNIIYHAFFGTEAFNASRLLKLKKEFQSVTHNALDDDYFADNYGSKFFSERDASIIGEIRQRIEQNKSLNHREYCILIASLVYSADKIANTVGHYDAYRKKTDIQDKFIFELVNPLDTRGKMIEIYREDSNRLIRDIKADVAFIDPPYNSRQYSRFYHVLEGIVKWDKPELEGIAMKPPAENMSGYSKTTAPKIFEDLILNLNVNYIVVTYNNTYKPKSSSSRNKITHDEITQSLNKVGKTQIFEMPFQFFNAGKTDLKNHKEFVFITEVGK